MSVKKPPTPNFVQASTLTPYWKNRKLLRLTAYCLLVRTSDRLIGYNNLHLSWMGKNQFIFQTTNVKINHVTWVTLSSHPVVILLKNKMKSSIMAMIALLSIMALNVQATYWCVVCDFNNEYCDHAEQKCAKKKALDKKCSEHYECKSGKCCKNGFYKKKCRSSC